MPERKEQVRRAIYEAFANLPSITEGNILRSAGAYEEDRIVRPLRGRSFREVPREVFTAIGFSVYELNGRLVVDRIG